MYFKITELLNNPEYYSKASHIVIKGSNEEIGYQIGKLAIKHGIKPLSSEKHNISRYQNEYMRREYPIHFDRMRGYSSAFNLNIDNYDYDFSIFGTPIGGKTCSAVYYPPADTTIGKGVISRNLDFCLYDDPDSPFKKIYILELHPEIGYSSVSCLCMETFGQSLEGINSEGLSVVHLADGETAELFPDGCRGHSGIGFNEFLPIQLLLDTCADVKEAKEALLRNRHYYFNVPVHFLIADRHGESFIWEFSSTRNREFIINGSGKKQIITNFLLSNYDSYSALPKVTLDTTCPFNRYRTLNEATSKHNGKFLIDDIKNINALVRFRKANTRTLAHSIYVPEKRELNISFYLKDSEYSKETLIMSEYFKFTF